MASTFQLGEHVVCRRTNSELRMLFDRQKGVMYELNETASAAVEILAGGPMTADQVAETLAGDFEAPLHEIRTDVSDLLHDFADAGLLVAAAIPNNATV